MAQNYILDSVKPLYDFPNWRDNVIKYAKESQNIDVYKRLNRVANGAEDHIHIFHVGGSHIQADMYSNKLRSYLQHMSPTAKGQRGFIYPYKIAGTNNPRNYRVEFDGEWTATVAL